jgi:hypothetical protein
MELHGKNMKEMEISDKCSLVGWYVHRNDCKNFSTDFLFGHVKLFEGSARHLIKKFDVKTRVYYGNTSMDSEMSLLMANQTLVS